VLIVDSDCASRTALERQTASWGMIPASVEHVGGALELLHRAVQSGAPFELALIDHVPGSLDGRALAVEIEHSPRLRSTRRVMLSAEPGAQTGAGVESVALKPLRPSRLYDHLVRAVNAARQAAPVRPRRVVAPARSGPGRRVLVAEDNEINQFAAIRMLQKLGYEAEVAQDGRQAVQLAARGPYTAIFMDCQMPELDGYEATAAIRLAEGEATHTPIIAMTANTMAGDRERCLAAGMDDYLAKPLSLERLAQVCERWLRADAPEAAPEADPSASAPGLFDPGVLTDFANAEQIAGLLTLFLTQLTDGIAELQSAMSAGEAESAARTAHRLKGSAATIGAGAMAEVMQAICRETRAGRTPSALLTRRAEATATATVAAVRAHLEAADTASVTAAAIRR
jgi:CheY-like chemotaxis protein/HPt (histidine-containing phosphotransfer) domain-containing protein